MLLLELWWSVSLSLSWWSGIGCMWVKLQQCLGTLLLVLITSYPGTCLFGCSSMAGKINGDIVKPFSGDGDIVAWLQKVTLVAKLQKIEDLAVFIPLYLEGDALALYLELSNDEQKDDAKKIKDALVTAFADSPFVAYNKLVRHQWTGEQVDVYATELRRLAGLAGFQGAGLNRAVKLAFISGFPEDISVALQREPGILDESMSSTIARARIVTANRQGHVVAAVRSGAVVPKKSDNFANEERSFKGRCFKCDGPHMARFCKNKVRCFRCNTLGHVMRDCEQSAEN